MPDPARTLTARDVAQIVNRDKRAVLKWSKSGLDHDVDDSGRQDVLYFDIREVRAYCEANGLDFVKGAAGDRTPQAAPADADGGEISEADRLADLEYGRNLLNNGRESLEQMAGTAGRLLETIASRKMSSNATASQLSSMATAVRNASQELRLVIEAAVEYDRQQKNLVDRVEAETLIYSVARDIMRDMDQICGDSPRRIVSACSESGIEISDADVFSRVSGKVLKDIVASVRQRRSSMLEQSADELEATKP